MQSNSFLARYKVYHIIFWTLVFVVWYYLRYQDYSSTGTALSVTFLKVADLAIMVYLTNYLLIPRLLYKKKYLQFAGAFILLILCSSISKLFFLSQILDRPDLLDFSGPGLKGRIYDNVIPNFFLVIAGAAVKLMLDFSLAQRRLGELAKEKAEAELNFLKSQINPHFLFNSLNAVYFLIDKNNPEAREALHKFSEMLRYQLYEMNGDSIPVEKEIGYLKDYVDLQKLRKDENYSVEFNCSPQVNGFQIEPLLLIPFVENAFKHLSHHKDKLNFVRLDLSRSNGELRFEVENSSESQPKAKNVTCGIGLQNVKRRLELLYPGKHWLDIKAGNNSYKISLKLKVG